MKYFLTGLIILFLNESVFASHPQKNDYKGTCYHVVVGKEGENMYYVPCDKDNSDIGFNEPNCTILMKGKWTDDPKSCDLPDVKYLQPIEGEAPVGLPKLKEILVLGYNSIKGMQMVSTRGKARKGSLLD